MTVKGFSTALKQIKVNNLHHKFCLRVYIRSLKLIYDAYINVCSKFILNFILLT